VAKEAGDEAADAMKDLQDAQDRIRRLNAKIVLRAQKEIASGDTEKGQAEMARMAEISKVEDQVDAHLANVEKFKDLAKQVAGKDTKVAKVAKAPAAPKGSVFLQRRARRTQRRAPEDELAKEMTHDLEMNFNKIAPFGKEDTAKELQDHAAKTQDTLVDAVENAEVAEIKRAVFRALTRLRAATIKEFDTIARLETQAIDAYNDAHHYRAENPLAHLHEDEAPVETDKLKSFH